ncbi:unnamed protein product [Hymenolepis diminuta]|uniref:Uncharacterized protein n=1 Tax=Hymenolepis diminuta TaxID=6216 RepID=A0A0R3SMU4_HYMDI|nr:unnamed protein product [Hymenolepis diminuta]
MSQQRAEQFERLGMGVGGARAKVIGHSAISDMKTIEREDANELREPKGNFDSDGLTSLRKFIFCEKILVLLSVVIEFVLASIMPILISFIKPAYRNIFSITFCHHHYHLCLPSLMTVLVLAIRPARNY